MSRPKVEALARACEYFLEAHNRVFKDHEDFFTINEADNASGLVHTLREAGAKTLPYLWAVPMEGVANFSELRYSQSRIGVMEYTASYLRAESEYRKRLLARAVDRMQKLMSDVREVVSERDSKDQELFNECRLVTRVWDG